MVGRTFLRNLAGCGRRAKNILREIRDDLKIVAFTKAVDRSKQTPYITREQPPCIEHTSSAVKPLEEEGSLAGARDVPAEAEELVLGQADDDDQVVGGAPEELESNLSPDRERHGQPPQAAYIEQASIESDDILPASTRAVYLAMTGTSPHDSVYDIPNAALAAANGTIVQLTHKLDQSRLDLLASKTDALSRAMSICELQAKLKSEQQTLAAIRSQLNNAELLSTNFAQRLQRSEEQHAAVVKEKQADIDFARTWCRTLGLKASVLINVANTALVECNEKVNALRAQQAQAITARDDTIETLKMQVTDQRNKHALELSNQRFSLEASSRLQCLATVQELKRRDNKEAAQEAELNVLRRQLDQHVDEGAAQEAELVELRKQLAERDETVATLKLTVDGQDKTIRNGHIVIQGLQKACENTAKHLEATKKSLERARKLNRTLAQQRTNHLEKIQEVENGLKTVQAKLRIEVNAKEVIEADALQTGQSLARARVELDEVHERRKKAFEIHKVQLNKAQHRTRELEARLAKYDIPLKSVVEDPHCSWNLSPCFTKLPGSV
ncbi:hypothetical protein AMS68_003945 [Peltaster fructicola]|uniref:Uncharacterized protein n=1 Tax=Peltaster fructicola TaxID=286661 RepID=A0A6H0XUZ0_9PEZI|nr:hypothetical protein AMS68_003945 [Peltaster fructicola]